MRTKVRRLRGPLLPRGPYSEPGTIARREQPKRRERGLEVLCFSCGLRVALYADTVLFSHCGSTLVSIRN